jgi:putative lipoic acid-binding regulatory protein
LRTVSDQALDQDLEKTVQARASGGGKYLALTVTVHVISKEQLDQIYQELSTSPQVIMAL